MSLAMLPYDLTEELLKVHDELIENGGELTPEIEERLAALQGAASDRLERILHVVRNMETNAAAVDAEITRLHKLKTVRENSAKRLWEYVLSELQMHDVKKLQTPHFSIWRQLAGRPSIRCEGEWPALFTRVIPETREFDSQAAYEHIKDAGLLPTEAGAVELEIGGKKLIVERSEFLRVK